jgi:hypothetical protein
MTFLLFWEKFVAALKVSDHDAALLNRADPIRLAGATFLTRSRVMAVAPAVSGSHVRKCRSVTIFIDVYSVTDLCAVFLGIDQNAGYSSR